MYDLVSHYSTVLRSLCTYIDCKRLYVDHAACRYLEGQLAVALGGRVAEELIYGEEEITTGASNDLQQVAAQARANL